MAFKVSIIKRGVTGAPHGIAIVVTECCCDNQLAYFTKTGMLQLSINAERQETCAHCSTVVETTDATTKDKN